MNKIVGAVMIIISTSLMGRKFSDNLKYRIGELEEIKKIMIMLKGEVMYNVASVGEALRKIRARTGEGFEVLIDKVVEELNEHNGKTFDLIWKEGVETYNIQKNSLTKMDLDRLIGFGNDFGSSHKEIQLKSFDMYIDELENTIGDARKRNSENSKMYKSLGILAGFVIVILII